MYDQLTLQLLPVQLQNFCAAFKKSPGRTPLFTSTYVYSIIQSPLLLLHSFPSIPLSDLTF